jgi:tetratricopeptide (TPR) repeat protein
MDFKKTIKTLLQEAEIYKSHGLSKEARQKYLDAAKLIKKHPDFPNSQKFIETIEKKVGEINPEEDIHFKILRSEKMSVEKQDIIKNEFSFSGDKDTATLEGAIALARFGQYERSLSEFAKLLNNDSLRVIAAKNILRCYIAISSVENAIEQYEKWASEKIIPANQLDKIRIFLEGLLDKKGKPSALTIPKDTNIDSKKDIAEDSDDDEFLDISSIGIIMEDGPHKGKVFEYDINFQSGNQLNFIISEKDQDLINTLNEGQVLQNVQFYSPISILKSSCIISSKIMVSSGPNKGNYSIDIKVLN